MDKKVLLKDIVIPKGTVFTEIASDTEHVASGSFGAHFGLSKNTSGFLEYFLGDGFSREVDEKWFTDLKE